jgi:hypothetical protein
MMKHGASTTWTFTFWNPPAEAWTSGSRSRHGSGTGDRKDGYPRFAVDTGNGVPRAAAAHHAHLTRPRHNRAGLVHRNQQDLHLRDTGARIAPIPGLAGGGNLRGLGAKGFLRTARKEDLPLVDAHLAELDEW